MFVAVLCVVGVLGTLTFILLLPTPWVSDEARIDVFLQEKII